MMQEETVGQRPLEVAQDALHGLGWASRGSCICRQIYWAA
jgi:hypothetical protein